MPRDNVFNSNALEQANKASHERMQAYRQARESTYVDHLKNVKLVVPAAPAPAPQAQAVANGEG